MPKVINNVNHERDKLRGSESLLVGLHHTLAKSGSSSIALYVSWIASSYCSSVYSTLAPTQKKTHGKFAKWIWQPFLENAIIGRPLTVRVVDGVLVIELDGARVEVNRLVEVALHELIVAHVLLTSHSIVSTLGGRYPNCGERSHLP